ncbi:MAG TPA: sensor histidine kinase [Candidatus Faecousia intestinigallinarum]|nr:sensor histidine kinase [Candidatus Faecousia intestinigallinarum]
MKKPAGLRRRWLVHMACVICGLGIVCAIGVTGLFAVNAYHTMEADLRYRADVTTDFLTGRLAMEYKDFYQSCVDYTQTFDEKDYIELQFINAQGNLVASSFGAWMGISPQTPEIQEAMSTRGIRTYLGKNDATGERILAVSSPIIYRSGEVVGVLRFLTSTRLLERQILRVGLYCLLVLAAVTAVMLLSSNYYLSTILTPVEQITQKAKRIAGGTYGIQIEVKNHDEIGELAQAINDLSAQISQNEKMQTEFISSLSHELRTPLTAITGWSETLLGSDALDCETSRGMKIILREAKRLTEMVVDLLDFTKMQDGRMTLTIDPTDIRGEFEDTVYMYGSRLAQEGIALELVENDEDIPEIPCDGKRMRQVFLNLLDNAAKHGGDGKRIEASIHFDGRDVLVYIRDFGQGIPEDELSLVKKKFYRGSSKTRGTGIGLAVCDEIVQMHGGELTLENAPGGGVLVTVSLPAAQ